MLTYFYTATEARKKDSLTLKIFDGERQIRTLKRKHPRKQAFTGGIGRLMKKGKQPE